MKVGDRPQFIGCSVRRFRKHVWGQRRVRQLGFGRSGAHRAFCRGTDRNTGGADNTGNDGIPHGYTDCWPIVGRTGCEFFIPTINARRLTGDFDSGDQFIFDQ